MQVQETNQVTPREREILNRAKVLINAGAKDNKQSITRLLNVLKANRRARNG